jgi:hypothetical protein
MEARRSGEGKRHNLVSRLAAQRGFAHRHECPTTCGHTPAGNDQPAGASGGRNAVTSSNPPVPIQHRRNRAKQTSISYP